MTTPSEKEQDVIEIIRELEVTYGFALSEIEERGLAHLIINTVEKGKTNE